MSGAPDRRGTTPPSILGRSFYSRADLRVFELMATLPYGEWRCQDGRVVLHNRDYRPLREWRPGWRFALVPNPDEWVRGIIARSWFYGDGAPDKAEPPWRSKRTEERLRRLLAEFGGGVA